jgi:integrase
LGRSEVSDLTFAHIQQRDGRWAIVDLHGKGNRIRTVPMPSWTKVAIDQWAEAVMLTTRVVFRPMNNRRKLRGEVLLEQNIMEAVVKYGQRIGVPHLAPHLCQTGAQRTRRPRTDSAQLGPRQHRHYGAVFRRSAGPS